jgi:hypothetical protein
MVEWRVGWQPGEGGHVSVPAYPMRDSHAFGQSESAECVIARAKRDRVEVSPRAITS